MVKNMNSSRPFPFLSLNISDPWNSELGCAVFFKTSTLVIGDLIFSKYFYYYILPLNVRLTVTFEMIVLTRC